METQIHGYRQGHQLLSSSVQLSKPDQSIIDRLSDVAGPLRPSESFDSYLTAYPLPSGRFFVLARTWQDLTVPRAGCVRTLSRIISSSDWQHSRNLDQYFRLLDRDIFPTVATSIDLSKSPAHPLPPTPEFRASELLEALFLEDMKPVALFGAPSPEIIALRLLSALWPALRRRFSLSTFALSPRKIEGKNFDLIFAPIDVRSRFADWPGRRIDARTSKTARHRWTGEIVRRVFESPDPRLLDEREIATIAENESGTPAALRIALLWDELLSKLEQSPSAALGLLDIAISKMHFESDAVFNLQLVLANAAQRAIDSFPPSEAWEFLGAMTRKIFGTPLNPILSSVDAAAHNLARRAPAGAITLLDHANGDSALNAMCVAIAGSFASNFSESVEQALCDARLATFKRLVVADPRLARSCLAGSTLINRIAEIVSSLTISQFDALRDEVLPDLVDDRHAILALPLFGSLSVEALLKQVKRLSKANQFAGQSLHSPLIDRARQLSSIDVLRKELMAAAPSTGRDNFLRMTLTPVVEDLRWLLQQTVPHKDEATLLIQQLLRQANASQFVDLFANLELAPRILERLSDSHDLLLRAATEGELALSQRIEILIPLLREIPEKRRREVAMDLLDFCLPAHFPGDERRILTTLLGVLGSTLQGNWLARKGVGLAESTSVLNRNLVVFNEAPTTARKRILAAIEELAGELSWRVPLYLSEEAADAAALLLWDAQGVNFEGFLRGSGRLLPTLFHSTQVPISALVAAAFPFVYRELGKNGDVVDILKFVPFLDWDRCKTARKELIEAFLTSDSWRPRNLALTACRALDVEKIMGHVAKSSRGKDYLARLLTDLDRVPDACRRQVKNALDSNQADWDSE